MYQITIIYSLAVIAGATRYCEVIRKSNPRYEAMLSPGKVLANAYNDAVQCNNDNFSIPEDFRVIEKTPCMIKFGWHHDNLGFCLEGTHEKCNKYGYFVFLYDVGQPAVAKNILATYIPVHEPVTELLYLAAGILPLQIVTDITPEIQIECIYNKSTFYQHPIQFSLKVNSVIERLMKHDVQDRAKLRLADFDKIANLTAGNDVAILHPFLLDEWQLQLFSDAVTVDIRHICSIHVEAQAERERELLDESVIDGPNGKELRIIKDFYTAVKRRFTSSREKRSERFQTTILHYLRNNDRAAAQEALKFHYLRNKIRVADKEAFYDLMGVQHLGYLEDLGLTPTMEEEHYILGDFSDGPMDTPLERERRAAVFNRTTTTLTVNLTTTTTVPTMTTMNATSTPCQEALEMIQYVTARVGPMSMDDMKHLLVNRTYVSGYVLILVGLSFILSSLVFVLLILLCPQYLLPRTVRRGMRDRLLE